MNGPAVAFCGLANKMIKEKWGFPVASAPSNGSYMWKKARELFGTQGWEAVDSSLEALAAFMYHDMLFSGPMWGAPRLFPAVAFADAFLATAVFGETKRLPTAPNHPLYKLFPEFVEQLKTLR
jgi:tetrahydromethanopterin S-methyltransferase subunit H